MGHLPGEGKGHPMPVDEEALSELIDQFVTDVGAAMHGATVVIGDKLGLYRALASKGPLPGGSWRQIPVTTGDWSRSGQCPVRERLLRATTPPRASSRWTKSRRRCWLTSPPRRSSPAR